LKEREGMKYEIMVTNSWARWFRPDFVELFSTEH